MDKHLEASKMHVAMLGHLIIARTVLDKNHYPHFQK